MKNILGKAGVIAAASSVALLMSAAPAFASGVTVHNYNMAEMMNETSANSNTGGNSAVSAGGHGGYAYSGSNANGGTSGNGGSIKTGNAGATAVTGNVVNSNDTTVDTYSYYGWGNTTVHNQNGAGLGNYTGASSNTGSNGTVSAGGNGGTAYYGSNANGGSGGNGGTVGTGDAWSSSGTVNVVNSNVTHITNTSWDYFPS